MPRPVAAGGLRWRVELTWLLSGLFILLLFLGGPTSDAPRSWHRAWDLGHLACFCFWTALLLHRRPLATATLGRQLLWVLLFSGGIGGLIELAQSLTPRTPSLDDLIKDMNGGLLALAFFSTAGNRATRQLLKATVSLLTLIALFPFTTVLIDEQLAKIQFPVLSDFETPFEKERWHCDGAMRISTRQALSGDHALQIELSTAKYSGVHLKYFPENWQGFQALHLALFNPAAEPLPISCRIHDQQHAANPQRKYADRYNRNFVLHSGWNELEISLTEVATSPKGRKMDLAHVRGLGIFVSRLQQPRTIFLDNVRLTGKSE